MRIQDVKVLERTERATKLEVSCHYHGYLYRVVTEIAEGRDLPNTTLVGFSAAPADEFIVALHEALAVSHSELVAGEMARICG